MEKIAIKGSGSGGGGTTFITREITTPVMSSTGIYGEFVLNSDSNVYEPCLNLIGGQLLGVIGGASNNQPDFATASKCTYRCGIATPIYFNLGDAVWDVGDSLIFNIDIIDNNANTLETMTFNTTGNQNVAWGLQTWDGDLTNKQLSLGIYAGEGYTFASIVIGGWSFGIRAQ